MMSRGSSVGSSSQQMQDGVAQHLDLTAPAVTRVHADAVVVRARAAAAGRRRRRRSRPVGDRPGCRPGSAAAASAPPARGAQCILPVRDGRAEHELHFAGVAAPRLQQRMSAAPAVGSSDRSEERDAGPTTGSQLSHSSRRRDAGGRGGPRVPPPWPRARRGSWPGAASGRTGRGEAGASSSSGSSRSRWQASTRRSAGLGRPMRARSRRHSSTCQTPGLVRRRLDPSAQRCTISGRCTA